MDEYIKREDALDAVLFALVGTGHQSDAILAVRDVPTADVVPRAEVENQSILWRQHFESIYETAKETLKAEVAREIFEEIEKTIRGALVLVGFSYKHNPKEIQCKKECYEDFLGYIAELKKKYTEGVADDGSK